MKKEKYTQPMMDFEDVVPILNRIAIFGGLAEKQLYSVFKLLEEASYRADEYIFRQGEEPSHIYIVLSGRVKIVVDAKGTPLEMIEFDVGKCFGETSVIGVQSHSASALAVEDTRLMVLPRAALHSLFNSDKELFGVLILNIAREACRRLHNTDETLLHYFCRRC